MDGRANDANRRRILLFAIALTSICIACSSLALIASLLARGEEEAQAARAPAPTPVEATPVPATDVLLTETPPAGETSAIESTAPPAVTPILRAATTTAALRGRGDDMVAVERVSRPSIARIRHDGSDHFSVVSYDSDGERIDLLVNTTGSYDGVVPIDFVPGEHAVQFEVTADGEWSIEILELLAAREEEIPGVIEGDGDEVIMVKGGAPQDVRIDASGDGSFALWSYGSSYDLVVSELAPYQGSVALDPHAFFLVISADVPWSLAVTAEE